MLYFIEENYKSMLLFGNRVSEYLVFRLIEHIHSTKLHKLNRLTCKHILTSACSEIVSADTIREIYMKLGQKVHFTFPFFPTEFSVFSFISNHNFLSVCHFIHFFDIRAYICKKMNSVYWSYIDRNIENSIKYRKRNCTKYGSRIKDICESIKNITTVDSISFLLFIRYKEALEPFCCYILF